MNTNPNTVNTLKILPVKHIDTSIDEAEESIELERSGKQLGVYCRYAKVNRAMLKYWRFGQVTLLAGMSSGGKSTLLNALEDDFTNPELNGNCEYDVVMLGFKYEMSGSDEVLRNVSGKLDTSYSNLLSADYIKDDIHGKPVYNSITDAEFDNIKIHLNKLRGRKIFYVETNGDLTQLYETYKAMRLKYPDVVGKKKVKFIITIDHTLLSKKLDEKSDAELMQNTGLVAIKLRKEGCMVILIGQLNGNIEDIKRQENNMFHYPIKTDVHCGNQVFWACNNVLLYHRPELLGIEKYGKEKRPTANLIHLRCIKQRFGKIGNIWLHANFSKGRIEDPPSINVVKK